MTKSKRPNLRRRPKSVIPPEPRTIAVTCLLTKAEADLVNHYVKKYKVKSRADLIRKTLLTEVLARLNQDYPTIFDE